MPNCVLRLDLWGSNLAPERSTIFEVALAFLLAVLALPAPTALEPGDAAPPLTLDEVLQAPKRTQTTWEVLRGKVVILEF
jgi:hypothetical protein